MQEEMGKLVGSKHQQTEGIKHQIEGNVQETVGDIKAAVKKVKNAK